jgi:hypothetical protein
VALVSVSASAGEVLGGADGAAGEVGEDSDPTALGTAVAASEGGRTRLASGTLSVLAFGVVDVVSASPTAASFTAEPKGCRDGGDKTVVLHGDGATCVLNAHPWSFSQHHTMPRASASTKYTLTTTYHQCRKSADARVSCSSHNGRSIGVSDWGSALSKQVSLDMQMLRATERYSP